ncbi:trimeric intracellular cation channel family protein [Crenobacter cavernae]|uniref:Trimeric intracellular cation channel family protein n=1 Tax=Crenobacter cavernae TaxID=2290923 RepID=A0ABY0FA17_9NEIS|nr:trimeric intracellular cation channel family protein [Crenobacter cavernae]RXZ42441.1 trimeric intracellular cation channel family protein [Crenobacter cavernae]
MQMDWFAVAGTVAFTFSGYLVGVRKHLDVLGVVIVSLLSAIGGGIIRDALVSRMPLVFHDTEPLIVITATLIVAWAMRLHQRESGLITRLFIVADSIGLVAFSLTGAMVGLSLGLNAFGVVMLSFVTAVGGGMVRDMLINEIPFILNQDFYGTVAILVAGGLYLLDHFGAVTALSLQALFWGGLAIRLLAHWKELALPKIVKTAHPE